MNGYNEKQLSQEVDSILQSERDSIIKPNARATPIPVKQILHHGWGEGRSKGKAYKKWKNKILKSL